MRLAFAALALASSLAAAPAPEAPRPAAPSAAAAPAPAAGAYDPMRAASAAPLMLDLTVHDAARGRDIPVRVYLPAESQPEPVVLYSHGLGGSRETSEFLGQRWARRGYVAIFLQHPGSDVDVWSGKAPGEAMAALAAAGNVEQFLARVADVSAVLDALPGWNAQAGHALQGRMDLKHIGMSGHSFGAVTAQAVSGQLTSTGHDLRDTRIQAAVIFSPSLPKRGDPAAAFAKVELPWLLMTGTQDDAPLGGATAKSRREVFTALPPGHKYELVLDGAEHSVFTDRPLPGEHGARNPRHHPSIEAISTAFWDAFLRGDPAARAWLDGPGPRGVLDPADQWQRK